MRTPIEELNDLESAAKGLYLGCRTRDPYRRDTCYRDASVCLGRLYTWAVTGVREVRTEKISDVLTYVSYDLRSLLWAGMRRDVNSRDVLYVNIGSYLSLVRKWLEPHYGEHYAKELD